MQSHTATLQHQVYPASKQKVLVDLGIVLALGGSIYYILNRALQISDELAKLEGNLLNEYNVLGKQIHQIIDT